MADKILQIITAEPGWSVYYGDGSIALPAPVALWALLEAGDGTTYISGVAPALIDEDGRPNQFVSSEWDGRPCSDTGKVSFYARDRDRRV